VLQRRLAADWKRIYYTLLATTSTEEVTSVHIHALDYYEGMLVVEEIYGPICLDAYRDTTLLTTLDARLLERFMRDCRTDLRIFYWHIFKCQLNRHSPALDYLISIVPELNKEDMTCMLSLAIDTQRIDLLPFIEKYASEDTDYSSLLSLAAERDNVAGWWYVLQHYEPVGNELLDCIGDCDSINIFEEYYRNNGARASELGDVRASSRDKQAIYVPSLPTSKLGCKLAAPEISKLDYLLDRATSSRSSKMIDRIEQLIVVDWKQKLAAWVEGDTITGRRTYTSVCLSKLDADTDLYSILAKATDSQVAMAILSNERIRVEKLSVAEAERLYKLVSTREPNRTILAYLSSESTYSLALRYLLFKNRDRVAMLDWMIEAKLDGVAMAAACALDPSLEWNEEIAPLRAIFMSLLYLKPSPNLSLWDIALLKEEGYSSASLEKSITLLSLIL
ncbi:Hypothetical protein POVR2_LOCUS279, partial [uncultured virus]